MTKESKNQKGNVKTFFRAKRRIARDKGALVTSGTFDSLRLWKSRNIRQGLKGKKVLSLSGLVLLHNAKGV